MGRTGSDHKETLSREPVDTSNGRSYTGDWPVTVCASRALVEGYRVRPRQSRRAYAARGGREEEVAESRRGGIDGAEDMAVQLWYCDAVGMNAGCSCFMGSDGPP